MKIAELTGTTKLLSLPFVLRSESRLKIRASLPDKPAKNFASLL